MTVCIFPDCVERLLKTWWRSFWIWNVVHYLLGLVATIGTVVIAAAKDSESIQCIFKIFPCIGTDQSMPSIVVAICTAILTFSKAGAKANAYIQAWRIVNAVKIRCEIDPNITNKEIVDAVEKAEEIIGKSD